MGNVVIAGAASGIGRAIAEQLQQEGHRVIGVDLQSTDITADLSTPEGRAAAVTAIRGATSDGLSGLVACAGVGSHVPDNALITAVNYFGAVDLVEGLRDHLSVHRTPVVLVSSNSAPMPTNADFVDSLLAGDFDAACEIARDMQGQPVYSGTKQALTRWMRRNTADYAGLGIRMNAIAPGYTRTPLSLAAEDDPTYADAIRKFIDSIPVGRPGEPQDMADAVSFLLSERAGFICGSMLFIDGGHDALLRPDAY